MTTIDMVKSPRSRLTLVLWLVGIHSFLVGVGLIAWPATLPELFGFKPSLERFFTVQAGVFHIVMAVAYIMAAVDVDKCSCLVVFSIIVKGMATVFLITYFLAVDRIWLVLVSALGDGVMGVVIYLLLYFYTRNRTSPNSTFGVV
ncbi:MAG: hypothetical protein U9N54_03340 [candidate division Zixibacteria bacterium]|nr:hypothetical protein [candidate division Zixibacteria bacterium]